MKGLHSGDILLDVEFELLYKNKEGNVAVMKYEGAWLIVDNGYLSWSTTVPPFKWYIDTNQE